MAVLSSLQVVDAQAQCRAVIDAGANRDRMVKRRRGWIPALIELAGSMKKHWTAALGGTIFGLLAVVGNMLALWATKNPTKPSPVSLAEIGAIVWACVSVPVAFFMAWTEQRETLITTEETLQVERDNSKPKLVGHIRMLGLIDNADTPNQRLFFVYMTIRNEGFHSVAKDFLPIAMVDGKEVRGHLAIQAEDELPISAPGNTTLFTEAQAIYNETKTRIEQGDSRSGYLIAAFDASHGAFAKELVRVRFRDYLDREFETPVDPPSRPTNSIPNLGGLHFDIDSTHAALDEDGRKGESQPL